MGEQEVTIKISAKNLTEAEFKKARKGLAGLGSSAKGATTQTTGLQRAFSSFGKAAPGVLKVVATAAAAAGGAIAALALGVIKLGQRGAEISAIETSFQSLTAAVGESGETMVAITQTATKGLVTDLEIMTAANKGLLLGLPITSDSMGELAKTAVVLGKAMGQGAGKSLDDLIIALGRSSPLILDNLGLTVKVGEANEAYAKKLGKTSSQLTEAEKKMAFYEAALEAARVKVAQIGGVQLTFGDQIQRGIVFVKNFTDSLSMMIAKSPALMAGMQAAGSAVMAAFGGDQKSLVLGIVNVIEKAALMAVEFGLAGVKAAGLVTRGFAGVKAMLLSNQEQYVNLGNEVLRLNAAVLEAAASVPVLGLKYKAAARGARFAADASGAFSASLKLELQDALIAAAGNDALGQSLTTAAGILNTTKEAIVNAGLSQRELNLATGEGAILTTNLGTTVAAFGTQLEDWIPTAEAWETKLGETGAKTVSWGGTTKAAIEGVKIVADSYTGSMLLQGNTVSLQTASMTNSFRVFGLSTRSEMEETVKHLEKHFEKIKKSAELTFKEEEKAYKQLQEAKKLLTDGSTEYAMTSNQAILTGTKQMLQELGAKNKAAAYASAVIGTAEGVVQALRSSPPPGSWILAGINAALGAVQIAKIASSKAYRTGTLGLDFQDFGTSTPAVLHGREAVIPAGGGHQLADEIASALSRNQRRNQGPDQVVELVAEIRAGFGSLPRAMQRAVRDGVLLAS